MTLSLAVVVREGPRAHLGEAAGVAGAALTSVHMLAGALWLGGLVRTFRLAAAWRATSAHCTSPSRTYARSALVLSVLVVATGTVSALLLLPSASDWTTTTYGRVLLVKLALFVAVLLSALAARRLFLLAPSPQRRRPTAGSLARYVGTSRSGATCRVGLRHRCADLGHTGPTGACVGGPRCPGSARCCAPPSGSSR